MAPTRTYTGDVPRYGAAPLLPPGGPAGQAASRHLTSAATDREPSHRRALILGAFGLCFTVSAMFTLTHFDSSPAAAPALDTAAKAPYGGTHAQGPA